MVACIGIPFLSFIGNDTPFHSCCGKDGLHVFRPVVHLVAYLRVSQRPVLPHCLQGSWADAEQPAHVIAVKPLPFSQILMFPAETLHLFRKKIEPRKHPLESRLLYDHYFHNSCKFKFDIDFYYKTERGNNAIPTVSGSEENKKIKTGCKPDERCHRQTSLFTAKG